MALSELLEADLNKALECSICISEFSKPKQLSCLHNFCTNCLKEYCNDRVGGQTKPCPVCRTEFRIPPCGVDGLPNNDFLTRIILMRGMPQDEKIPSKCEICAGVGDEAEGESFCLECKQCLCGKCKKRHSLQTVSASHNVVALEVRPSDAKRIKLMAGNCSKHVDQEAKLYCGDCCKVMCYVCMVLDHGRHNCKLIDEAVKQKKVLFSKDEASIRKCFNEGCEKLQKHKEERDKIIQESSEAADKIEEAANNIANLMSAHKNQLLDDVTRRKEFRLSEIDSQERLDQLHNTGLDSLLSYGRMMMERGTDCEIIRVADELHKKVGELIKSEDEHMLDDCSVQFLPSPSPSRDEVEKMFGRVLDTAKDKRFHCMGQIANITPSEMNKLPISGFHCSTCAANVQEIAVLDDKIFILQQSEQALLNVYDFLTLNPLPDIDISYVEDAKGMVGCSQKKILYIGDNKYRCVNLIYMTDPTTDDFVDFWYVKYYNLSGMSLTLDHNVLVTVSGPASMVLEYTSEGQLIREIGFDIAEAWSTIQLSADQFIVCHGMKNSSQHGLCVFNSEGQIIKGYGAERGSGENQLDAPCSVTIDRNRGRVFVADCGNGRVLIFSQDLELRGQIQISERYDFPSRLCFDSGADRLVVGDAGDGTGRFMVVKVPDQ